MNSQRSIRNYVLAATLLAVVSTACNREQDQAVKGRTGPNGPARDTVSDLALNEDGSPRATTFSRR